MKRKISTLVILMCLSLELVGQYGYVKLNNDSILIGYLRFYRSIKDGHPGIELWRTKNDKTPLKIPKRTIQEYAIKKDTFKVLGQFKPFHDSQTYFELIDAKLESRGKVNLFIIENIQNTNTISAYTMGGAVSVTIDVFLKNNLEHYSYLYILENQEGYLHALPAKEENLKETLFDFFPEKYITKYEEVYGKITYDSIDELVRLYNSK